MSRAARLRKKQRREEAHYWKMTAWAHYQMYPDDGEVEESCWRCGGDGYLDGSELAETDPFWYDSSEFYKCNCCNGSGNADDCTYW